MTRRKRIRSNYALPLVIGVILVGVVVWMVGIAGNRPTALQQFLQEQSVPYSALVPNHLPAGASFLHTDSSYDTTTKILTLRWVFPAQTLPGQGTLILYQYSADTPSDSFSTKLTATSQVDLGNGNTASVGNVAKPLGVPTSPGERGLHMHVQNHEVLLISYTLSDSELENVAASLR